MGWSFDSGRPDRLAGEDYHGEMFRKASVTSFKDDGYLLKKTISFVSYFEQLCSFDYNLRLIFTSSRRCSGWRGCP